jgi:glycerol-3-phosphate O-acyltransferase/dihydroxyacetone phosphate acyltransferase
MVTPSHQAPFCSGDGEAYPFYRFIRGGFRLATQVFYGGIVCDQNAANLPPVGEPALLCFNHPNSLLDPMVLMSACPRMIRFIAKDTLWKVPLVGWLVQGAAAVPVKKKEEHSGDIDNGQAQEGVLDAWSKGHIVGVSPEGGSLMRTMFKKPFKKGFLYWLVDSVFQHWEDEDYKVHVVPSGIVFLHPFSWRSEAMVRFGTCFPVDRAVLQQHGATEQMKNLDPSDERRHAVAHAVVNDLVNRIEVAMDMLAINIPPPQQPGAPEEVEGDWAALQSGIVAARVLYPKSAELSLRKWVDLIKHFAKELQQAGHEALEDTLQDYYQDLKQHGLRDAQVHEVTHCDRPATCLILCRLMLQVQLSFLLFTCALPGAVCWFPLWLLCRITEHCLVRRGRIVCNGVVTRRGSNFDSIASIKMMWGFVYFASVCAAALVLTVRWVPSLTGVTGWKGEAASCVAGLLVACLLFPILILLSMRLCESAMAAASAARELKCLLSVKHDDLQRLVATRSELHRFLSPLVTDGVQALLDSEDRLDLAPRRSIWKREKKDWHECFLPEDLTWSGLVDDSRAKGSSMVTPLL